MYVECAADEIVAREFNHERPALRILITVIPNVPAVGGELSAYKSDANRINHLIQRHASLDAVESVLGQRLLPVSDPIRFIQIDKISVQARRAFGVMQFTELSG